MERRDNQRIPLDMPCLLTLMVNGSGAYSAMAVDVSAGGVQIALSPGTSEDAVAVGGNVVLRDALPPFASMLDGATGTIAWVGRRCCGVRLDKSLELAPSELANLAKL